MVIGLILSGLFLAYVLGASQKSAEEYLDYVRNHPDE